jgi:HlyD family secretion protein
MKSKLENWKQNLFKIFTGENWKRNVVVLLLFLGAFSFVYYKYFYNKATTVSEFIKVEKKDIKKTVEGGGKVVSVSELDIQQLQNGGKVTNIYVKPGESVRAGDVIARLDSRSQSISLASAKANYDKVVNGATDIELQILKQNLLNAQNTFDLTVKTQDLNVLNAKRNLLNSGVAPVAQLDSRVIANNPTISGSYICDVEKEYRVTVLTNDLASVSETSGESYTINISSVPQALGKCGLYLNFDSTKSYINGDWKITLPNKISTTYSTNLNSYNTTVQARETALNSASTSVALAKLNLEQKILGARSEEIAQAKAQLDSAKLAYENTIIRAPFDGQIGSVSAIVGQQTNSQQGIATIITKTKFAEVSLNEVDIVNVKLGQKVEIKVDAIPDKTFKGTVSQINTVGVETSNVTNFGVKISIDEEDERIRSGMSMTANIITEEKAGVLSVPASTVKTTKGKSVVERKVQGKETTEKVLVEVGLSNDIDTEVVSGLNEGDEVLYKSTSSASAKTQTTFSLLGGGGRAR